MSPNHLSLSSHKGRLITNHLKRGRVSWMSHRRTGTSFLVLFTRDIFLCIKRRISRRTRQCKEPGCTVRSLIHKFFLQNVTQPLDAHRMALIPPDRIQQSLIYTNFNDVKIFNLAVKHADREYDSPIRLCGRNPSKIWYARQDLPVHAIRIHFGVHRHGHQSGWGTQRILSLNGIDANYAKNILCA